MEIMIPQNRIIDEMKLNSYVNERTIYINEEITDDVEFIVNRMFQKIIETDDKENILMANRKPIYLKISSPGGNVFSTLSIVGTIETVRELGYKVIATAYGICMSGAFKIFISCSERIAQRHTRFMFHSVQTFELGHTNIQKMKNEIEELDALWTRCKGIILKYTKITEEKLEIVTKEQKEIYLWSEDCIALGIVDYII